MRYYLTLILISFLLESNSQNWEVISIAGNGNYGFTNGTGNTAQFDKPSGICGDSYGNLYIADHSNHVIRKIDTAGVVTTFAGSGIDGFSDGNSSTAQFSRPWGCIVDNQNRIYVADVGNERIRRISTSGTVTTIAGNGTTGTADGPALSGATFSSPSGMAIDSQGNLFVVDRVSDRIRKITPTGTVTTVCGSTPGFSNGTGAGVKFDDPQDMVIDSYDNIYVADRYNNRIRKITPSGVVSTFAGTGSAGTTNGTLSTCTFNQPRGMAIDEYDNIYVIDYNGHKLRKIDINGNVTTLAGNGSVGYLDGPSLSAEFNFPYDVGYVKGIYIAGNLDHTIRKLVPVSTVAVKEPEKEISLNDLNIFPNPSNGNLQIEFQNPLYHPLINILIYNETGQCIFAESFDNDGSGITLNLENLDLPGGIYILRLECGETILNRKIIFQ